MRIDWTQTLMGVDGQRLADGSPAADRDIMAALKLGRLLGLIAAAAAFGLALVAVALGGIESGARLCLAFAALIALNAMAFALLSRFDRSGIVAAGAVSFILPLAGLAAGLGLPALALLAAIGMLDVVAHSRLAANAGGVNQNTLLRRGLAGASLASGLAGMLLTEANAAAFGIFAIACLPLLPLAMVRPATRSSGAPDEDIRPLAAMLAGALRRLPGEQVITDIAGTIEPLPPGAGFALALAAAQTPTVNLVDRVLIADRPPLLHALSRAIHGGEASEGLVLRLNADEPGRAAIAPPRFVERRVGVAPAPGLAGRVIVSIEPVAGPDAVAAPPPAEPEARADSGLLARAFHDCVAPFNAGLGYLEMLTDPTVAPRDIATFRAYAGEAHQAVLEAHRNALLLARWLKLAEGAGKPLPMLCRPADLARESLRLFHLDLPITEDEGAAYAELAPEPARFAMLVLLRAAFIEAAKPLSLRLDAAGHDLSLTIRWEPTPGGRGADALQAALEDAAARHAGATFQPLGRGGRRLVLPGALPLGGIVAGAGNAARGHDPARLAS